MAARRLGVSSSTVLNQLRRGQLAGRQGDQPVRPRWYVTVDDEGDPLAPDGTKALRHGPEAGEPDRLRATLGRPPRMSAAGEVALRLKAAGERQRRALELQAEAINELAAALHEQGEAIAQLLLPDTVAELGGEFERTPTR